jgi:hypothetical protein
VLRAHELYAEACRQIAGEFAHHRPILTEAVRDGTAKRYTMRAPAVTGYEFGDGEAESCCPPHPGG